jgi:hypothetical protein
MGSSKKHCTDKQLDLLKALAEQTKTDIDFSKRISRNKASNLIKQMFIKRKVYVPIGKVVLKDGVLSIEKYNT